MKKFALSLMFVGIVLTFGTAASAQLSTRYSAEIPFDFQVEGRTFKAGSYKLEPIVGVTSVGAIALRSKADNSKQVIGVTQLQSENPGESKLIFVKQDGRHMLQRIDTPTIDMKFKTESSSRLARADVPKPEIVAVVLR